jgi:thioredoxin-dependent peroxiredoxin
MSTSLARRAARGAAAVLVLLATAYCQKAADAPPSGRPPAPVAPVAGSDPSGAPIAPVAKESAAAPAEGSPDAFVGKPAPDFTAMAQDGTTVHLAALKGKPVVVYFYPKDETPGCTKEACSFRDSWKALAATGAVLVGVSADSLDSHKGFAAHYQLPFRLVSDPDGAIGQKFGVPFHGVHKRQTIVIGADGIIKKVYRQVDVSAHAEQVLGDLKS